MRMLPVFRERRSAPTWDPAEVIAGVQAYSEVFAYDSGPQTRLPHPPALKNMVPLALPDDPVYDQD
jgi:hypothetical protein